MADLIKTVIRGTEILTSEKILKDINNAFHESEETNTICNHLKSIEKNEGTELSNSFIINQKIYLTSVGFFGPRNLESAKYDVTMRLDEIRKLSSKNVEKVTLAFTRKEILGMRGEIFYVNFDVPVLLHPSALKYTISFQIQGPETLKLDSTKISTRVKSAEGVEFYFWPGSQQIPTLRFITHSSKQGKESAR